MSDLFAWTDGACSGNPGPGGWGVLMRAMKGDEIVKERELSGGEPDTTNNRMELQAVIEALRCLKRPCDIDIYTDSQYVQKGISEWITGWKARGWRTASKAPVKNADLWQMLDAEVARHRIQWHWVKGHAGHEFNERADELANRGVELVR